MMKAASFLESLGIVLMFLGGFGAGAALTQTKWLRFWLAGSLFGLGEVAALIAHHLA